MGYAPSDSGRPCWYELGTTDLAAASEFYAAVLGWQCIDPGMAGVEYRLASSGEHAVAGLMSVDQQHGEPTANWVFYTEVADCDRTAQAAVQAGATISVPPTDIPGTGRYAVLTDPQGAAFGLLQPNPMDQDLEAGAYDPAREGHGCWHELNTSDLGAAFAFYSSIFGWEKSHVVDMGDFGDYQLYSAGGQDLGGIMSVPEGGVPGATSRPAWTSYFTVTGVGSAVQRITEAGGRVISGPHEVPGGAYIAVAVDPQGAMFGVSGPSKD